MNRNKEVRYLNESKNSEKTSAFDKFEKMQKEEVSSFWKCIIRAVVLSSIFWALVAWIIYFSIIK